jgi:hypothetical protein
MTSSPEGNSVHALQDLEAIRVLKARYCRFLDCKQWPQLEDLFTADCTFAMDVADQNEMGPESKARLDRRGFVIMVRAVLTTGATSVHHVHAPELSLLSPGTATGIWAMEDYVVAPLRSFRGYGHYHETYRKEDGTWRISAWRLDRLRIDPLPG